MNWELVFWTLALLLPLLWLVRQVHEGLQGLFFLLTGHVTAAVLLFQILLLPGVALHELSHYLAALLLGVRVRQVSLRPQVQGQKIRMGAVVMDKPDPLRGLLIGLAPFLLGSTAIILIGHRIFEVGAVIQAAGHSDAQAMIDAIRAALRVNDAGIWVYLLLAISNAMLPSASDRDALWPMLAFGGLIAGAVVLAGRGPDLLAALAEPLETGLSLLVVAFGITLFVDVLFVLVLWLLKGLVSLLTGRRLEKTA
jgi:hypothetical protein